MCVGGECIVRSSEPKVATSDDEDAAKRSDSDGEPDKATENPLNGVTSKADKPGSTTQRPADTTDDTLSLVEIMKRIRDMFRR